MAKLTIVSEIEGREVIARDRGIRELARLKAQHGGHNWRKCKGEATIELPSGKLRRAEIHWYEAHGIGKRDITRKRYLD